jgi:hypothetical protein
LPSVSIVVSIRANARDDAFSESNSSSSEVYPYIESTQSSVRGLDTVAISKRRLAPDLMRNFSNHIILKRAIFLFRDKVIHFIPYKPDICIYQHAISTQRQASLVRNLNNQVALTDRVILLDKNPFDLP